MMQKGDKVKIYQKPVTREQFEGEATLVKQVRPDVGDGLSIWMVHFANDYPDENYQRTVFTGEPS